MYVYTYICLQKIKIISYENCKHLLSQKLVKYSSGIIVNNNGVFMDNKEMAW